jgi:PAS domain S-box-containing protein
MKNSDWHNRSRGCWSNEQWQSTPYGLGATNNNVNLWLDKSLLDEMLTAKKEIDSVKEEIEASKKKLHALNEKLRMANRQLRDNAADSYNGQDDFMSLMKSSGIAVVFLDDKLRVNRSSPPMNPQTQLLLNLVASDIERPLGDLIANCSDNRLLADCQQVLDTLVAIEREVVTDECRSYLRRIQPYRTNDHTANGLVILFFDLTEHTRAEMAKRESDLHHAAELQQYVNRLHTILESAADPIVTFDRLGRIDSVNSATESLFGYQRGELIGENLSLLIPSGNAIGASNNASKSFPFSPERISSNRQELWARRRDGSLFPAEFAINKTDHLDLFVGILRDVSDQKELQAHVLEVASGEQRRIGQELHDGIQQELTGLSLFASALSSLLENAQPVNIGASPRQALTEIDFERIAQTVAKLSAGLRDTNNHVCDLSHRIMPVQIDAEGLRSALEELAKATNEIDEACCYFEFSGTGTVANNSIATQLYRITQESISNALKHGLADEIVISLSQNSDQIILVVSDNGSGICTQNTFSSTTEGDSIGIRMMKYRASTIGGVMQIDVNNGIGTTVRCTVPATVT